MVLTTTDEMIRLGSQEFQDLRLDDLDAGDQTTYLSDLVQEATDMVLSRLLARYEESDLSNSKLVRRWCTIIALFFLSQRRDNSANYISEYERVMEELERIRLNETLIPGVPTRSDLTPSVTNYTMDERYVLSKMRVREELSTGGSHANRKSAEVYPSDWY